MTDTMITLPEADVIKLQEECETLKSRERRLRHTLELWRKAQFCHVEADDPLSWSNIYALCIGDVECILGPEEPEADDDPAEAESALSDAVDGLPYEEANAIRYGAMLKGA